MVLRRRERKKEAMLISTLSYENTDNY